MCRSGLWERGLVFRRWRALLPNERVSGAGLGVLHVEGIFDGSLMGGWEEIYVGGLVVVVVVKTSLMVEVGLRFDWLVGCIALKGEGRQSACLADSFDSFFFLWGGRTMDKLMIIGTRVTEVR